MHVREGEPDWWIQRWVWRISSDSHQEQEEEEKEKEGELVVEVLGRRAQVAPACACFHRCSVWVCTRTART